MSSDIQKSSNSRITLLNHCLITVFITLVLVTVIIRVRTLAVPLERDEGEYAYTGQLILQGIVPYSLAYNMKMPGIYAAYAVILACFGQSQSGIHAGVMVINAITILLLFFLTKKLFGPIAGLASAVFFAITSISSKIHATANAENFVVIAAIAGIILLMNYADSGKYLFLITAGILSGIAFMMKQHGAGFIFFGLLYLLWNQIHKKKPIWRNVAFTVLVYSFFAILPFLVTCLILWYCGVFEKFWFWTFKYAQSYVSMVSPEIGFILLKDTLTEIIPPVRFIWLAALFGILSIIWNGKIRKHGVFLVSFFVCSFLSVCPGFYFRNHYFVLFLPALSLLASAGIIAVHDLLGFYIKSPVKTAFVSILVIVAVWLHSFYNQKDYLLESDTSAISRHNFGLCPFPETLEIANFLKKRSDKDDKIAVLGSEPQIFFYAHRRSATAYIYTYPLMEPQPYAADMQRQMISQIETDKPKFIVFVNFRDSWLIRKDSQKLIFNWMEQYIPSHYRQIGLVEAFSPTETLYRWDSTATPSKKDDWIFIGERID